ncbi:NUDIX hydrolase [Hymenobacter edaphi]|uniref:DNA mismatch repair protein MutT n=1 Tax=Hymenobacter edaphi TaxID=2211146 RepID=A0A328B822_9BACT|nr:DNA mismatch repair protein MutT [Hymenobacter edaphi]
MIPPRIRLEGGLILMARCHDRDVYYIPDGKRKAGKTDTLALMREIGEKLNVVLLPETAQFISEFTAPADQKPADVLVRLRCYSGQHQGQLAPAAEIADMAWVQYVD